MADQFPHMRSSLVEAAWQSRLVHQRPESTSKEILKHAKVKDVQDIQAEAEYRDANKWPRLPQRMLGRVSNPILHGDTQRHPSGVCSEVAPWHEAVFDCRRRTPVAWAEVLPVLQIEEICVVLSVVGCL